MCTETFQNKNKQTKNPNNNKNQKESAEIVGTSGEFT